MEQRLRFEVTRKVVVEGTMGGLVGCCGETKFFVLFGGASRHDMAKNMVG